MKWKGRRQSDNVEYDFEYGKHYDGFRPAYGGDPEQAQQAIVERIKRDILRRDAGMQIDPVRAEDRALIKDPINKRDRKVARDLVRVHDQGKTPIPSANPRLHPRFAKGGTVGQVNPFYNYTNGLRHFHQLDDAPPVVGGVLPVLPELQPLMQPAGLETLLPQQPGNSIPMQQYASGGIVTLTPYQRALLDTIAGPESAGRYNVMYGGKRFSDYSDHPRVAVPIKSGPNVGKTSSAAGKYQFLGSTWDQYKKKLGLPDFSPQSQDQAAWALAKDSYGGNLDAVLQSNDPKAIAQVGTKLRNIWTSLPGGIEQGTNTSRFVQTFQNNLVNPGKALPQSATSPMMMGAKNPNFHVPASMPGSTGLAALAPAIPVKTTSIKPEANALSAFTGLMALAQLQQPKPTPAPAPVSRGTRRVVDYEEETQNTSQTPGYYRRKRRRNG